ncbi:MAG: PKD domain-containing protein [bacterium]|jgi:PKD repeat protein
MKGLRFYALLTFAAYAAFFVACSGQSVSGKLSGASGSPQTQRLDAAIEELMSLEAPPGADADVWSQLKFALADALKDLGKDRFVSIAPIGTASRVPDLSYESDGDGTFTLKWTYRNHGDYDQSGEVGISDITPIALNYLQSTTDEPLVDPDEVIDGDFSGEVGVSDITPIALNFQSTVAKYLIEGSNNAGGPWTAAGEAPFPVGQIPFWFRPFSFDLGSAPEFDFYRVVPDDGQGNRGIPSNVAARPVVPIAPDIISVSPLFVQAQTQATFTAVVEGDPPHLYTWNFGGGASPNTSNEPAPTVTAGSVGIYSCTVRVSNGIGEETFPFTLEVTPGAPPDITSVSPLSAQMGQQVTFTASVTGDLPMTYAWDFGGGATPDTSADESPTVNAGDLGSYDCTLTVTNASGNDVFPFTFQVTELPAPPVIFDVQPQSGQEGEIITFNATVDGAGPLTYTWDFGGGAAPNTSSEISPQVTLGAPGTYPASLVLSNEAGNDTFNFDLTVNANPLPPDVISVSPTSGIEGNNVTFSAVVTGTPPFTYAWDFGGGGTPDTSGEESPLVTLGPAGVYDASLTVTNAQGEDIFDFSLTVNPPGQDWSVYIVADGGGGEYASLGVFGGKPCIAYYDPGEEDLMFAYCSTADGSGTWTSTTVDSKGMGLGDVGRYCYLANMGGVPGISYYEGGIDGNLKYAENASSDGTGTWFKYTIDSTGDVGMDTSCTKVGGRHAFAYYDADNGDLKYARANTTNPGGTYTKVTVDSAGDAGWSTTLLVAGGKPVIGYFADDGSTVSYKFAYANDFDGTGTWTKTTVRDVQSGLFAYGHSLCVVGFNPAVGLYNWGNGILEYGVNAQQDGSGAWTFHDVDGQTNISLFLGMAEVGGLPAIAFRDFDAGGLWAATCDTADGSGTWSTSDIDSTGGLEYASVASVDGGRIGVAYYDSGADSLKFAIHD